MRLNNILQELSSIASKSVLPFELSHAHKTLEWLLKLKPEADDVLKIAAFGHDVERGITGITETYSLKGQNLDKFKKEHALRSAEIIRDLMIKHGYSEEQAERCSKLVELHEVGGTPESDILKEADSLAFFNHVDTYFKLNGPAKAKVKFGFMVKRLSPQGIALVKQMRLANPEIQQILDIVLAEI